MDPETNKATIRRLYTDFFNGGDLAVADALLDPDYVGHDPPDSAAPLRWPRARGTCGRRSPTAASLWRR
jgi:ketosteroid isomerase-like protein